ncbi:hypothetical protein ACH4TP_37635 [Streptomyces sp. NPDC021012]|uniref:hypothetical protein n=1 Tax=Streptomyces sp. NPDC021012 TaxID=3365107 RepID=UPI0037A01CA0
MTENMQVVRLRLSYFDDFTTVAGLLRDSGARRTDSREFVLDRPMTPAQVVALFQLMEHSRQDHGFLTVVTPRLPNGAYWERHHELDAWWGTVNKKPWLAESAPEDNPVG